MITSLLFMAAAAASPPATANAQPPQNRNQAEKKICKTDDFVGSRIPRRVCKTEAEWKAGRDEARDAMNEISRGGDFRQPTGPN